ncbi:MULTISPECIES: peptidoglycan DD-metalloendopeptidase family protein [unclassified Streptomyces]|uniref:peptidoglycan DD-metalloendopeptidase family protein n=1 Tax=unclassified Streptomyces TaxID=2593676 RepID=UPI00344E9B1D
MNDQHPHAGYVGDDAHTTGSFAADPLFGTYPAGQADHSGQWDLGQYGSTGTPGTAGQYDTTGQWDASGQWNVGTPAYGTPVHETSGSYETIGSYEATGAYPTTGSYETGAAQYDATGQYGTTGPYGASDPYDTTGQWDASAWTEAQHTGQYETAHSGAYAAQGTYGYEAYDTSGQWAAPAFATETGAYDATAWNHAAPEPEPVVPHQYTPQSEQLPEHTAEFSYDYAPEAETGGAEDSEDAELLEDAEAAEDGETSYEAAYGTDEEPHDEPRDEPAVEVRTDAPATGRPVRRSSGGGRGRRRTPAKRSALLTVAVPSACVMGVAGIAAASVGGLPGAGAGGEKKDSPTALAAAPDAVKPVAANNAFNTQLDALATDARDFGSRASRAQERIDLKVRQEAEKKKREEEAIRKEAMRPKFALPVKLHRLSARFGQSGVNWMSVHTGIDFPVFNGTPVMAATDGTVRTQLNSAYGNMVIVTAPDGTETWYCHLSSAKIRSGSVKAGEVIAYSGDSGNSTGPHLHFEVRPGGGYAIDPLAWLRSHGLDPTS